MVAQARILVGRLRHVAVGARHAGSRVNALAPQFELGMLGLESRRARVFVGPVAEADLVVIGLDLLDLEALRPGKDKSLFGALEVVLDMALTAHEGAHLLP